MSFATCKMWGGLGNQLFQIIATYAYAYDNNLDPIFDTSIKQIESTFEPRDTYWDTIFNNISKESSSKLNRYSILDFNKPFINDKYPDFEYVEFRKRMHNMNVKLNGYFQSYKYFHHLRSKIIDLLKPNHIINQKLDFYINNIVNNNTRYTVSLHVRRGDYLKLSEFHRVLPIEYYINAIKYFTPEHTFVVFSDDIEWCKINLSKYLNKVVFIEDKDYIELYLMSKCQHNIIANSSFSWWGAYLNTYQKKITIAPKKWFGINGPKIVDDLFLPNWIILDD